MNRAIPMPEGWTCSSDERERAAGVDAEFRGQGQRVIVTATLPLGASPEQARLAVLATLRAALGALEGRP